MGGCKNKNIIVLVDIQKSNIFVLIKCSIILTKRVRSKDHKSRFCNPDLVPSENSLENQDKTNKIDLNWDSKKGISKSG